MPNPYRRQFGVYIPLWETPAAKKKPITLEFVLTGIIPSKKNRQRASFNYSWAMGQVRSFFKGRASVGAKECMAFVVRLIRNIRPFIFKPKEIADWEVWADKRIQEQLSHWRQVYHRHDIVFPVSRCSVSIKHYWADHHRRDNNNREQTIHDLLVSSKIIQDDTYQCLYRISSEAGYYGERVEDHVTLIHVTIYDY